MAVDVPAHPGTRGTVWQRTPLPAPDIALGLVLIVGTVINLIKTRGFSFFGDDWDFVAQRHGLSLDTLLLPHNPHLSLVPVVIYKVLLNVFGGSSFLPFRLLDVFDLLLLAGVVAFVGRRRWGPWLGLIPAVLLVTLGQAGTSTLWSFQCGYAIATGAGVIALLGAARRDRTGDRLACGFLIVSLASGSQGIGFLAGAAVMLVLAPGWRRRAWVVLVPAILYGLWYVKYGHSASETELSLWTGSLQFGVQELGATFGPLLGLSSVTPESLLLDTTYGLPVAVGSLVALAYAYLWRGWRPGALFWGVSVCIVVLFFATATSNTPQVPRFAQDSRYLASNAALVLIALLLALPRPTLPTRAAGIGVSLVVLVIAATNINQFAPSRSLMLTSDQFSRAQLGAMLLMQDYLPPTFPPAVTVDPSVLVHVTFENFIRAYRAYGLPVDTPAQIAAASEPIRATVDGELARGELVFAPTSTPATVLPPAPRIVGGTATRHGACLIPGASGVNIVLGPGRYGLRSSRTGTLTVAVQKFASTDWSTLGTVPAGTTDDVYVRSDLDPGRPWVLHATGSGVLCPLRFA